jgi:hypothetical protein
MIKRTIGLMALVTGLSGCMSGDPEFYRAASAYLENENERRSRAARQHNEALRRMNEQNARAYERGCTPLIHNC